VERIPQADDLAKFLLLNKYLEAYESHRAILVTLKVRKAEGDVPSLYERISDDDNDADDDFPISRVEVR